MYVTNPISFRPAHGYLLFFFDLLIAHFSKNMAQIPCVCVCVCVIKKTVAYQNLYKLSSLCHYISTHIAVRKHACTETYIPTCAHK